MARSTWLLLTAALLSTADAAVPAVDFERMGTVGLAGAFAGLDLFNASAPTFDPTASTLFSRSSSGALTRLAATNAGGSIHAACALNDLVYFAGSFSSLQGTTAANVASFDNNTGAFAALGSGGPSGQVDAIFCDSKNSKVWVGGSFSSPASNVAIWDPKASSWSKPPFNGVSARVRSITTNSSASSVFIAGSFSATFQGNGGTLNGTNNPNVPFSKGATPFSSSLVPVPLGNAEVDGSPSSSDSQFNDVKKILCPAGADGPGNTWLAADGSEALVTVRKFSFISAHGIRLGNTFLSGHGTTGFTVTTIPDNTVQTLNYLDPSSGQNTTCSNPCPLSSDSSLLYQDFLFSSPQSITGVQIKLSQFSGSSSGLHLLQILSSGAFAASGDDENGQSCFAPNPSNSTRNGDWSAKVANTNIAGTTQTVLVSSVNVGTSSSNAPSFTWVPYVSASGDYDINLLVPGCTNFQDCPLRTSVKVTVFPGNGLDPVVKTISQANTDDSISLIYSGPILPTSPDFVTTVTMTLADQPEGNGQGGKYELVADRVQLVLRNADVNNQNSSGAGGGGGLQGAKTSFGFLEWPLDSSSSGDATQILPNSTETFYDNIGFSLASGVGASSSSPSPNSGIASVAHHASGAVFIGGNFSLSSGSASGSSNVVSFKGGSFAGMAGNGLNGAVTSFALDGDRMFVGGSFSDTVGATSGGALRSIALYDVQKNSWSALGGGVNGQVSSISIFGRQLQVAGTFTRVFTSSSTSGGVDTSGLASWDIDTGSWVSSGGFVVGNMSLVANGTESQIVAGNVVTSRRFGATGMVFLKNGDSQGPAVTPLGSQLEATAEGSQSALSNLKGRMPRAAAWLSNVALPQIFSRQSATQLAPLPTGSPATSPAVLAGAFWTNSSDHNREVTIIGGNFSFHTSGGAVADGVAFYNAEESSVTSLQGGQINGTVRTLLVDGNSLYVGGQFSISGIDANGFAIYDLPSQSWAVTGIQSLQGSSGAPVVVRSITKSSSNSNTIIVAGSFAQAGSLKCQAICSLDVAGKQWNPLGGGIQGEISTVSYSGNNQEQLIAAGSIALPDNTMANVAQFVIQNASWSAIGKGADVPGPVTALEVNNLNGSSIFAAGQSTDGKSTFLTFWNGVQWSGLSTNLDPGTIVSQLAMVPLQEDHAANAIIETDRMLMVSGALSVTSFGNASSALFDGQSMIPYFVSATTAGAAGSVAALFHSFASFSFAHRRFLAVGVVILISIAISAGVVFLLALMGILWTLFSRRDDKLSHLDAVDDDDDSTHHRPSSLLEHINAATRTTILGAAPFSAGGNRSPEPEEEEKMQRHSSPLTPEPDPFGADAGGFARVETPSDAMGGLGAEENGRPAHVRYSFDGTGDGELPISAGAEVEVLDDRDSAWWYARDVRTGQEGVVPAAYLY